MNPTTITYNGLTIGSGTDYKITLAELDLMNVRTSKDSKTSGHGGYIWTQLHDIKPISIEGMIFSPDVNTFFTDKSALLNSFNITPSSTILTVNLWNGKSKSIDAKVITTPIIQAKPGETTRSDFRIELECEDPYWMDTSSQIFTLNQAQTLGATIPSSIPMSFPIGTGGSVNITNTGDVESYPRYDIYGPCTNPTVFNSTTGNQFQIQATLQASDIISVYQDASGIKVYSQNGVNYFPYFTGSYFSIAQGVNNITFSSSSSYNSNCKVVITYTNKYYTAQ